MLFGSRDLSVSLGNTVTPAVNVGVIGSGVGVFDGNGESVASLGGVTVKTDTSVATLLIRHPDRAIIINRTINKVFRSG